MRPDSRRDPLGYNLLSKAKTNKQTNKQEDPSSLVSGGGGLVAKSCPTLANPMDCSLPGPSVHRILQAKILEWVSISFFKLCF